MELDLRFEPGLHALGEGCFAWLQPNGSWGLSNAGLLVDGDESLLVDTLFDYPRTAAMLAAMRDAAPAARHIGTLINTHANPDHTSGNALVEGPPSSPPRRPLAPCHTSRRWC